MYQNTGECCKHFKFNVDTKASHFISVTWMYFQLLMFECQETVSAWKNVATDSEQSIVMSIKLYTIYSLKTLVAFLIGANDKKKWKKNAHTHTQSDSKEQITQLNLVCVFLRLFVRFVVGWNFFADRVHKRTLMESKSCANHLTKSQLFFLFVFCASIVHMRRVHRQIRNDCV